METTSMYDAVNDDVKSIISCLLDVPSLGALRLTSRANKRLVRTRMLEVWDTYLDAYTEMLSSSWPEVGDYVDTIESSHGLRELERYPDADIPVITGMLELLLLHGLDPTDALKSYVLLVPCDGYRYFDEEESGRVLDMLVPRCATLHGSSFVYEVLDEFVRCYQEGDSERVVREACVRGFILWHARKRKWISRYDLDRFVIDKLQSPTMRWRRVPKRSCDAWFDGDAPDVHHLLGIVRAACQRHEP